MNLTRCVKVMSLATGTALLYIHIQMQIVELAYKGKDKEKHAHELADSNGILAHQILTLKSAVYLGKEVLAKDEGLKFMGRDQVMTLVWSQ